jgi:ribosomal protein S18 acetylase RimI-like enzyme
MTIQIKEAKKDEIELVYQTMKMAFSEYLGKLNPPSGALSETTQEILYVIDQGGGAVLAWNGLIAAGSARYKYDHDFIYIGRVSVIPEFRGRGIGKLMLAYIEDIARARGIYESRVEVRLSIPENIQMIKKL